MSTEQTMRMTSRQISELTGKQHRHVLVDIERLLKSAGIAALGFKHSYLSSPSRELELYTLPKRECLLITSNYSDAQRMAIYLSKSWCR